MYKLQTALLSLLYICYFATPVIAIYFFATDKHIPENIVQEENLTEEMNSELQKNYKNYDNHILCMILSLILHIFNFILNLVSSVMVGAAQTDGKTYNGRAIPICCLKSFYLRPVLGQAILYILCLGCSLANYIFIKKSDIIIEIPEQYEEYKGEYNNAIDNQINSIIIMLIIVSSILALSILYIILDCCYWKTTFLLAIAIERTHAAAIVGPGLAVAVVQKKIDVAEIPS